jgi:hypothetical protein
MSLVTAEQLDLILDCLFKAAENAGIEGIGNRADLEEDVNLGEIDRDELGTFFQEFARLWSNSHKPGFTLIANDELQSLRDMAWQYAQLRGEA